ncbi:cell wall-binding repeat-containing protein [Kineococcus rubinsiae]|uniref:cell wall-binding repeat-containing protein n=1 Tax=Kineococcus rubinsiae TaxID=2609562 RepID=UPI00143046F4|nr:cell wall-binding repeat-containing protein [Kineococcus rubinsiae]
MSATRPARSRAGAALLSLGVLTAGLVCGAAEPAAAESPFLVQRLTATADRFQTSASLARTAFPDGVSAAMIVNGENPVDALAASAVAGTTTPVLYTRRDAVPADVLAALHDLGVRDLTVVGGPAVVSEAVVDGLRGSGFIVRRISGRDRFETAATLARTAAERPHEDSGWRVLLVRGDAPADALAVAPVAALHGYPLLLTGRDHLPDASEQALRDVLATHPSTPAVTVVGSPGAVAESVLQDVDRLALGQATVERWYGPDRYATAVAVADRTTASGRIGIANGVNLVDALPGAILLARSASPVLLSEPGRLGPALSQYVLANEDHLSSAVVLGGTAAVPDEVVTELRQKAVAPPVRLEAVSSTATSITVSLAQRAEYRYRLFIAPSRPGTGEGSYAPVAPAPPAGAREVPWSSTRFTVDSTTIDDLAPGTRYDLWVARSVDDVPQTFTGFTVDTD